MDPAAGVALNALIAMAIEIMEEEEQDFDDLLLAAAHAMVEEIMDLEEDIMPGVV